MIALLLAALTVAADPEPAVDVVIREPSPPRRIVAISFNSLPVLFGKVSLDLVVVPLEHHGLVFSPFYVNTKTEPIYAFNDMGVPTRLPEQKFSGRGGELGYRYYSGRGGPRGFFLGPSLILGWLTATAENGSQTQYRQLGFAADVGSQMLVADRVSLTLGGGVQYVKTDKTIPNQQFPARLFANSGVLPRLLFSLGAAF